MGAGHGPVGFEEKLTQGYEREHKKKLKYKLKSHMYRAKKRYATACAHLNHKLPHDPPRHVRSCGRHRKLKRLWNHAFHHHHRRSFSFLLLRSSCNRDNSEAVVSTPRGGP